MQNGGLRGEPPVAKGPVDLKIGIIACGAIVRELLAIARRQGWDFELTALPAPLHNRPERIAPALARKLDAWANGFDLILVGYGDCGSGGAIDALLARYPHVVRIPGPHCYEFYGGQVFTAQAEREPGTFYLTDFLARHFEGLVIKGLGLDRHPQLRDHYFGNYKELLYLRQLPENDQSRRARQAAERLGLRYREADTGLEVLEARLVALVEARRQELARKEKGGMSDTRVCPVCESPLTTDAVREGRCQCCGSPLPSAGDAQAEDESAAGTEGEA